MFAQRKVTRDDDAARAAYAKTHGGKAPATMLRVPVECAAGAPLVALGPILAVEYGPTDKGKGASIYRHVFEGDGRPTLAVNARTGRLHFVGGRYDITHEGVEDKPVERSGPWREIGGDEAAAAAEAARAYERLHGAPPDRVFAAPLGGRCEVRSLAALGPLVAVEWRAGPGATRRHELRGTDALLAFDSERSDLHVVGTAYNVGITGEQAPMYEDPYAVVANPGRHGHENPHMRANPGMFLERDELPAEQHETHIVIGGTLIAAGLSAALTALIEYLPNWLPLSVMGVPSRVPMVRGGLRLVGLLTGIGVSFKYPVIGAAVAGTHLWKLTEGVLDSYGWGPTVLAPRGGTAEEPAGGLPVGGVFSPFPTGAVHNQWESAAANG